jgi:hypothetical protein
MSNNNTVRLERQAKLQQVAERYFEGLAKKDVADVPWDDNVILHAPLAPGGFDTPITGKAAVHSYFASLYGVLGEVRIIEHYFNAELTAVATQADVGITNPPVTLHVLDSFKVSAEGKIVEQRNHFDPRSALGQG